MKIEFWKPDVSQPSQTWLINIENSWYEISGNAPNQVNMYAGEAGESDRVYPPHIPGMEIEKWTTLVPRGIVNAVVDRIINFH